MTTKHRRTIIQRSFMGRPLLRGVSGNLQEALFDLAASRARGEKRRVLSQKLQPASVAELRQLDPKSKEFKQGINAAKKTVAGQLALAAWGDETVFNFLLSRNNVIIDKNSHPVGVRRGKLFGVIGRERIPTKDILWLMLHFHLPQH